MDLFECIFIHAIALAIPIGDVVADIHTHRLEIAVKEHRRHDTVAIVVSVDRHPFAIFRSLPDARDRFVHILQRHWVGETAP